MKDYSTEHYNAPCSFRDLSLHFTRLLHVCSALCFCWNDSFFKQIEIKEVTFSGLLQIIPIYVLQQLETVVQNVKDSSRKLQTRRKMLPSGSSVFLQRIDLKMVLLGQDLPV